MAVTELAGLAMACAVMISSFGTSAKRAWMFAATGLSGDSPLD